MPELTIILDRLTSRMFVEASDDVPAETLEQLAELSGPLRDIACAAPLALLPPPRASAEEAGVSIRVRISGFYHNSLIEGPGRRSSAKLQGCSLRCAGCITPESWDPRGGTMIPVDSLAEALLDPAHERDGVSILGGEPFAQPEGLRALVLALRERGCRDILVYSGYTYERLRQMAEQARAIGAILDEVDVLVDGPYVEALTRGAGPWTGSGNQRVIDLAATRRTGAMVLLGEHLPCPKVKVHNSAHKPVERRYSGWRRRE